MTPLNAAKTITAVLVLTLVAVVYIYGFSPAAQSCQAKGGSYGLDFACRKITITPVDS